MFSQSESQISTETNAAYPLSSTAAVGILTFLVILLGIYPSGLIEVIQNIARNFL
jgi:hypothetical protein